MSNDVFSPSTPRATHLKYVRLQKVGFVLWKRTDDLFHSDVAERLRMAPDLARIRGPVVISAGFACLAHGFVRCWGRSESLDIGSLPEDAGLLAAQLGLEEAGEESEAQAALRSLACWLGVGGYNAPTVDAKVFEQKIRDGVAMLVGKNEV